MATRTTTKKAELKTSTAKPATEKEASAKKTTTVKAAVKGTVKLPEIMQEVSGIILERCTVSLEK